MIKTAKQILRKPFSSDMSYHLYRAILVGIITGLIVSVFRWVIDHTMQILNFIYPKMAAQPMWLVPYVILMIVICLVLGHITKPYLNQLVGSGVPQIEAVFLGENKMPWWSILWRKFVGGLLAICPGLMLGREGPCIEMGAMVGQGLAESIFESDKDQIKELQECGVAAGLAAAFSAPIAGAMFLVEEISFSFKPKKVVSILAASVSADFMTILFFGEAVPNLEAAAALVARANVLLIVGTSMQVYPAASLYRFAPSDCGIYVIDPDPSAAASIRGVHIIKDKATSGMRQFRDIMSEESAF